MVVTRMARIKHLRDNGSWSMDFVADRLGDGSKFRTLTIIDVFTRDALAIEVGQGPRKEHVVTTLNPGQAHRPITAKARAIIETWKSDDNESRPHTALNDTTTAAFARQGGADLRRHYAQTFLMRYFIVGLLQLSSSLRLRTYLLQPLRWGN